MADLLSGALPAATRSIHRNYLEQATPAWLIDATSARRAQLKKAPAQLPAWFLRATAQQQRALNEKFTASFKQQTVLDKAMARLQDIDAFAEPLLVKALQEQFQVKLDVHQTLLQLHKPVEVEQVGVTFRTYEIMRLPLLQAALHNFEARECEPGAFLASSGFITQGTLAGKTVPVSTLLTVPQFTALCRSLDIGAKYQRYLNDFLRGADPVAEQVMRQRFTRARKADLAASAEQALLTKDIEPADYQMIVSVINGETNPRMGKKQVWFQDLGLMKKRMTGCVAFVICEKYRYADELILYIPHDPHHPLKRYTWPQMQAMFKQRFTARDTPDPGDGSPTAYQRFFSQFVGYGDLPAYFNELNESVPASEAIASKAPYSPLLVSVINGFNPFSAFTPVLDLPPDPPPTQRPNMDPFLNAITLTRKGHGIWADNIDLWDYLFEQHRDKLFADARRHAVPTADVDARVRSEKFAKLLGIGLLALNVVSMFVPVLGEVMMVVMAGQLLYETLEGSIEWSEGDRRAAKAHLVDVAENLAFLAVMAVGGKVLSRVIATQPEPLIEDLDPVALPNGQKRLWRADLAGYESAVTLPADVMANPQGEYQHAGKSYIRQSGKLFEKTLDASLNRWRIRHPTDPQAYQPLLSHNGAGAWRHTLERPLTWDRTTLMRRMGPAVDRFTDEQLLQIATISGTRDSALRKMHLDDAPPPPVLADTLRLFKAEQDVAHVIEQIGSGHAVDERYLYTLPLVTEMPRWPVGRVLEVFDEPSLTGPSQRYGVERLFHGVKLKPPIRISRADVLANKLPAHVLGALDESEVVGLLGNEPARVRSNRPQEFRRQIADYARTRQPALFDSLYAGTEKPSVMVAKLQRLHPGLSEHAAQSVLDEASIEQLERLYTTGRAPLAMQEHARWYILQGRLGRAYTGLHMENMLSADSKRLALHTLGKLPGWPQDVRLENREGSIAGVLLDSIGPETARHHKYLVKRGPSYQAFNDRGEALTLRVSRTELMTGQLPARIARFLSEPQMDALVGRYTSRLPAERIAAVQKKLQEQAVLVRARLMRSLYTEQQPMTDAAVTLIQRDFKRLPTLMVREMLAQATPQERATLDGTGRIPLTLAQRARLLQQDVRLSLAYEGLYLDGMADQDTEALVLNTLGRLPGWTDNVRLEVREGGQGGALRASFGPDDAAERKVLVRVGDARYQARNERDEHLHGVDDLYASLQHALPDRHRQALGLPHVGQGAQLKQAIIAHALPREQLRTVLKMQSPVQPLFKLPSRWVDGRIGYPLSGQGRYTQEVTIRRRVHKLFPAMTEAHLNKFLQGRDLEDDSWLLALEQEFAQLDVVLSQWMWDNSPGRRVLSVRRNISKTIRAAWRNSSARWDVDARGAYRGQAIEFSDRRIGRELATLPALPGNFDHVTGVSLSDIGLTEEGTAFLATFRRLRALDLSDNDLTQLPKVLEQLPHLEHLALENNEIVLTPEAVAVLRAQTRLNYLFLDGNPLGLTPDIGRMGQLNMLTLAGCELRQWPVGIFGQQRPREFQLDLTYNELTEIPDVAPGSERAQVLARTIVSREQVSPQVLASLMLYIESVGLDPERNFPPRGKHDSVRWKAGLTDEQWLAKQPAWDALEAAPKSEPFFDELRKLSTSSDTEDPEYSLLLTAKVWRMLEAMAQYATLRKRLFRMALAPTTCVDAGAQLFNAMGVEILLQEALAIPDEPLRTRTLLELAIGRSRLTRLSKIAGGRIDQLMAQGRVAPRFDGDGYLIPQYDEQGNLRATFDEVEIHLAYATQLADPLALPWQSRSMKFPESDVTEEHLEIAYKSIADFERGELLIDQIHEQPFWTNYIQVSFGDAFQAARNKIEAITDLQMAQRQWSENGRLNAQEKQALRDTITTAGRILGKSAEQIREGVVMDNAQYDEEMEALAVEFTNVPTTLTRQQLARFPQQALAPWSPGLLGQNRK
ncbi:NEL-type E3 ubiquitin ligase domain-containing protein [Pseudomonas fluorescens]|uniref:NEL-type E3 ubiquitin ligase domain-containing protein n=1 Tax=Pseudomonas fluorescens TaxID=294 RepID=UPI0020CA3723|nr:DUF6543 domain-containing protein [Pseudomonas fluorescens]